MVKEEAARFRVEFTDASLQPAAAAIVDELSAAGGGVTRAALKRPRDATLGTPEIIITVLVTAAAKAVIVAGIRAIQRVLAQHMEEKEDKRAQIVLENPDGKKQRFPISLRGIGKEALKQFTDDIVAAIGKL
jgi:hypothetical protein